MTTLWQDIRYGLRMLAKNPGFTAVVIVILAVGIGATTTMLSVVDAMLLRPAPYEDPESLVHLYPGDATGRSGGDSTSYPNFVDWRDQSTVFEQVAGVTTAGRLTATTETRREWFFGLAVTPEYFSLLRIKPALGRVFLPEEAEPSGEPVAIISHRFWQDWYGGDPDVVGKTVVLDEKVYTVIGVLAADFRYPMRERDLWLPLRPFLGQGSLTDRGGGYMWAMARLKNGVTLAQARAEMDLIGRRLAEVYPDTNAGSTVRVVPITREYRAQVGQSRQTLLIAQGTVVFVLLIACFHVAALLLVRSADREREIAIRAVLGAVRRQLVRQLLTEGVLLALLGGALGLLLAYWGLGLLSALRSAPSSWQLAKRVQELIPWFIEFRVDARTLLYVTGVSLLTCGLFGVWPAVLASETNPHRSLCTGRTAGHGLRLARIRSVPVTVDIAVAFVLLIGAGLLVNSYARLHTGLGYSPARVLSATIGLDEGRPPYSQAEQRLAFFDRMLERVRNLPGVESAVVAGNSPAWGGGNFPRFRIEGYSPAQFNPDDKERFPSMLQRQVSADYFATLQIPLLKGRCFSEQDRAGTAAVAIINESMARRFWPDQNPVGRYLTEVRLTRTETEEEVAIPLQYQIVGVVGDTRHFTEFKAGPSDPEVYVPCFQHGEGMSGWIPLIIRTRSDPRGMVNVLRNELLSVDSGVLIRNVVSLEDEIATYVSPQRFNMLSLSVSAAVALALAATGIYGVTAYAVSRRTHEIGIRMALGARGNDVMGMVLRHGLRLTVVGLAIGGAGALAATRIVRSLLYDVSPTDPLTFAVTALLLTAVALLASYLPARRAAKIDPMAALRCE